MKKEESKFHGGWAKIENGEFVVNDPEGAGKPAILVPQEGIRLYINGNLVNDKAVVTSKDSIYYENLETVEPYQIEVKISRDNMTAEINIEPEKKIVHKLLDQEPQDVVYLKTEKEEKSTKNLPAKEEILKKLKENGIENGIDESIVDRCASGEITSGVVAKGTPPEPGRDGYVEYFFKTDIEEVKYENESERIDFRERFEIPQVEEGEKIAEIQPPVEGTPGRNIKGEDIPPDPVKEATVNCGEGVELVDNKVIAQKEGRPFVKKSREPVISVEPLYAHKGDVDMKSGNIRFNGDVRVQGGVSEGMTVNTSGSVEISNNCAGAYIIAGGNIVFKKNCINCQVEAGGAYLLCQKLCENIEELNTSIETAASATDQLMEALKEKGIKAEGKQSFFLQNLMQTKFPDLPGKVKEIKETLQKADFAPSTSVTRAIDEADQFFVQEGWKQAVDSGPFYNINEKMREAADTLKAMAATPSNIEVYYVQNSTLKCSGDIHVVGPGSYNSYFECTGKVFIQKLLRGGSVVAGDDVEVGEAGSPGSTSAQGSIKVPADKSIKFGKVHEGTKIVIGNKVMRFDDTVQQIKARLDREDDRIKLTY